MKPEFSQYELPSWAARALTEAVSRNDAGVKLRMHMCPAERVRNEEVVKELQRGGATVAPDESAQPGPDVSHRLWCAQSLCSCRRHQCGRPCAVYRVEWLLQ